MYVGTSAGGSTELDGDNYAWNGSGWDDLSGEYRAGAGIVINGKVISATGISFIVGDGLQATGSGSTTTLSARITNGIEFVNLGTPENPVNALGVKKGSGIVVNSNGVNVKTGETTKTDTETGSVEVNYKEGLTQNNNGQLKVNVGGGLFIDADDIIKILANFNIKLTPLGNVSSKLALYSDGKIGVDFTESPVVLTGELLYQGVTSASDGKLVIGNIPNLKDYDMYYIGIYQDSAFSNEMLSQIFYKPVNKVNINMTKLAPATPPATYQGNPKGMVQLYFFVQGFDANNNNIDAISGYGATAFLAVTQDWNTDRSNPRGVRIFGIKAR